MKKVTFFLPFVFSFCQHAATVIGNKMIVVGGESGNGLLDDVQVGKVSFRLQDSVFLAEI